MLIKQIQIKNFRCFESLLVDFHKKNILLEGLNGAGKTSLLEALHYACYLRSFRTYSPQELMRGGTSSFFIKIAIGDQEEILLPAHEIQVGFSGKRRLVKIDQKQIVSYKELLAYYRVVTLTEDDLALIKEGPDMRRAFLDQVIMLFDPDYIHVAKKLRHMVDSRNALFKKGSVNKDFYDFWTEELWTISGQVRAARREMLATLQAKVTELLNAHFPEEVTINFDYQGKKENAGTFADFMDLYPQLCHEETMQGRSLFGAHLDDFAIHFKQQKSRVYASRGQQKLIIMLLKIAQIQLLLEKTAIKPIFLLDDFMTDFDPQRGNILITILKNLGCQLIFTAPAPVGWFHESLSQMDIQHVKISI